MNIPYRTRRIIRITAVVALIVVAVAAVVWLSWFTWLKRFVVYTRDGAVLDMNLSQRIPEGQTAVQPEPGPTVPIYYNEGENTITTNRELSQLSGYYIDRQALIDGVDTVRQQVRQLKRGTPVMLEVKSATGNFFYSSAVAEYRDSKIDPAMVDALMQDMETAGVYMIALLPSLRDRQYGLNNVNDGIFDSRGAYLYRDEGACYWLNPKRQGTLDYIVQIISELKGLGFDEVVLDYFAFPDTDHMRFDGDKAATLQETANAMAALATGNFAVSFVQEPGFQLPGERSRLYLKNATASEVQLLAQTAGLENPAVSLVFMTDIHDTRFNEFSVLRPLDSAH